MGRSTDPPLPSRGSAPLPLPDERANGTGSLGGLFRQLAEDGRTLIQQEIALAKAEVRSNVVGAAKSAAIMGIGLGLLLVALLVLIAFLVLGLGVLLDGRYWLSALIVGGVLAILGLIAVFVGRRGMREQELKPQRTIDTLRDNTDWARAEARQIKRELTSSDGEQ